MEKINQLTKVNKTIDDTPIMTGAQIPRWLKDSFNGAARQNKKNIRAAFSEALLDYVLKIEQGQGDQQKLEDKIVIGELPESSTHRTAQAMAYKFKIEIESDIETIKNNKDSLQVVNLKLGLADKIMKADRFVNKYQIKSKRLIELIDEGLKQLE